MTPAPPAMASTPKATRTSTGSTPSCSPSPPATPSSTRLSRLRTMAAELAGRRGTWVAVGARLQVLQVTLEVMVAWAGRAGHGGRP